MGCCGSTQKVRKVPIPPEHRPLQELKPQVRQDDIIQVPKDKRKLFRVDFDLKKILPPEYLILQSVDYTTECISSEILQEIIRQEIASLNQLNANDKNTPDLSNKVQQKSLLQSQANSKNQQSTQANRIAQRQVHVQIIDELPLQKQRRSRKY